MKKALCMIALAAVSFGSVYAAPLQVKDTTKVDTTKVNKTGKTKIKTKTPKDTTTKKM